MNKEEIALSMKDEYLSEKKVDYVGYAATKFVGYGDKSKAARVFDKTEFSLIILS